MSVNPMGYSSSIETEQAPQYQWEDNPCPVCESRECIRLGDRGGQAHKHRKGVRCTIVQCRVCSHLYPHPMPMTDDPNALYHDVDEYFVNHDPQTKIEKARILLQELERYCNGRGRMLDIGSGRGELLYAASFLGWDPYGVEASAEFTEFAKATYGVQVTQGTLARANYPDATFDLVTLGAVLEHLYDPKGMLRQIHRILKPDGVVWIDVPNEASLYNTIGNLYFALQGKDWVSQLSPTFAPYHVQGFTRRSLLQLLTQTGFSALTLKLYTGRTLLSRKTAKEHFEYWAASLVNQLARWTRTGPYMEVVARAMHAGT